jgi:hypothetical protein
MPPGQVRQIVLMDYRIDHLRAEELAEPPTFPYAKDLGDGSFFVEATSLVRFIADLESLGLPRQLIEKNQNPLAREGAYRGQPAPKICQSLTPLPSTTMADTPTIKIIDTIYSTIRSALTAATSGSTIALSAGSFNITKSDDDSSKPENPGSSPATLARATASDLTIKGAGHESTTILGNARLYARGLDGDPPPNGMSVENLSLIYENAEGYIFSPSRGSLPYDPGSPTISNYSLLNVVFSGQHRGAGGASGTYMDISGSSGITFNAIKVSLSGQSGYNSLLGTGGGFFIFNEGGRNVQILNSEFYESGYSSSILVFSAPDVRVDANRFLGEGLIKQDDDTDPSDNPRGERFYNTGGSFTNNYLSSGAFFDYFFNALDQGAVWQDYKLKNASADGTFGLRTVVTGNTFDLLPGGYGILIRSDSAVSVVQNTLTLSDNVFNSGVAVRSELLTQGELVFGSNRVNGTLFDSLHVGGVSDDLLNMSPVGGSTSKWISGGPGNDQLYGSANAFDAFVFWAPLDSQKNLDTIHGFETATSSPDQIWLDASVFDDLSVSNGILNASSFTSNANGLATGAAGQIIYNTSTGKLSYDADGTGANQAIAFATLEGQSALSASTLFLFGTPETPPNPPPLPSIALAVSPASVTENGSSNLTFTFTRTGSTTNALTASYTVGGTASLGVDYTGISTADATKTVVFAAGAETATIILDPSADSTVETNETVSISLAAGIGYTIDTVDPVTGVIRNDDAQVTGTIGQDLFGFTTRRNTYTGLEGKDTFRLSKLNLSLFSAYDFITDFTVGQDIIDTPSPRTQPIVPSILTSQPTALTSNAIGQLLNGNGNFTANGASVFTYGSLDATRTFLALNNSNTA